MAGTLHGAEGAVQTRNDPELLAALRADPPLRDCRCILAAAWLNESYPRITVDARAWRKLGPGARSRLGARALKVAEAIYLAENAGTDQYEQAFFVDRHGKVLTIYQPSAR